LGQAASAGGHVAFGLVRETARERHTKVGWWLMTHDRGGAAVIGAGAFLVLIADLLYASGHWSGSFRRSFLVSVAAIAVVALISLAVRSVGQIGTGRRAERWNQRGMNFVFVVVLVAFIEVGNRVGGNFAGGILGALAALAAGFALYSAAWIARRRS
jgi:hypothetical protein